MMALLNPLFTLLLMSVSLGLASSQDMQGFDPKPILGLKPKPDLNPKPDFLNPKPELNPKPADSTVNLKPTHQKPDNKPKPDW